MMHPTVYAMYRSNAKSADTLPKPFNSKIKWVRTGINLNNNCCAKQTSKEDIESAQKQIMETWFNICKTCNPSISEL